MMRIAAFPGMWERTITIGSAGKTFSLTGWKLGWAIGPTNLIRNCQVAHQNCVYVCPTPIQEAVARALEVEIKRLGYSESYFNVLKTELKKKRDFLCTAIKDAGMVPVIPEGGYFVMADWSKLEGKVDLTSEDDSQKDFRFAKWLIKNKKLQGIPPSAFFSSENKHLGESYIRLCYIKKDQILVEAKEILQTWN